MQAMRGGTLYSGWERRGEKDREEEEVELNVRMHYCDWRTARHWKASGQGREPSADTGRWPVRRVHVFLVMP
jgi:hypothetical protein